MLVAALVGVGLHGHGRDGCSADEALALKEAGETFDVIVSDIEMPGTDGFAFARTAIVE